MKLATTVLKSLTPYGQSKFVQEPKLERELADDYEKRTWKKRCHYDESGHVFIPPSAFKNCIAESAKFLGLQIPGKGKSTFTKHFEAGVLVTEGLTLDETEDQVQGEWLFLPADGKRGSGRRVLKCMPRFNKWSGTVKWHILDDIITKPVFQQVLENAGQLIGLGFFRPRNNGFWGRFSVEKLDWQEV